mmetsp:Transcript_1002/g.3988  ORF Transcript_1002/g.3988 Transcript_1002/m.3988 type:complete len:204 (+) Transcript_1002:482-1093(+)
MSAARLAAAKSSSETAFFSCSVRSSLFGDTRFSRIHRSATSRTSDPMVSWIGSGSWPMMTLHVTSTCASGISRNRIESVERSDENESRRRPSTRAPATRNRVENEMTWTRPSTQTSHDHGGAHESFHSESSSEFQLRSSTTGAFAFAAGNEQLTYRSRSTNESDPSADSSSLETSDAYVSFWRGLMRSTLTSDETAHAQCAFA